MAIPDFIARWETNETSERADDQLFLSKLGDELGFKP